jgi:hypothetical protein
MEYREIEGKKYKVDDLDYTGRPYADAIPVSGGCDILNSCNDPFCDTCNPFTDPFEDDPFSFLTTDPDWLLDQ